ncbi:VapE domain-containing protein [Bdellovibrionota bacterium FG-2]
MISHVRHLHDLGFAIHLLHPHSKRPIGDGWASCDRRTFPELLASYTEGGNVGVRLGAVSKIGDKYLAVIDCDVKSKDPKYKAEMEKRLGEIFGETAPVVTSGRGNGSRHVYVLTKEPQRERPLAESKEIVKVKMPSALRPNKTESKTLTPEELASGIRLRAAWEIVLMGEGQQVVLPPSIHPDSGKAYVWQKPIDSAASIPIFDPGPDLRPARGAVGKTIAGDFKPVLVDLIGSALPHDIVNEIISGEGVTDRSGSLYRVAMKMYKFKFSDNEILSVLTDPENYLGQVAYEHAQTKDRGRAAEWVRKYTLEKAKREVSGTAAFEAEVEEAPILSEEEAKAQEVELCGDPEDWRSKIERTGGNDHRPKPSLRNTILILTGEIGSHVFRYDDFSGTITYGSDTPWGAKEGNEPRNVDIALIKRWFAEKWRFEPGDDKIVQAWSAIAHDNRFHPIKKHINQLEWDKVPRLDNWLKTYLGASAPEPYLSAISRKVFCAMVARVYSPGIKFDCVLILEGAQGKGKSRTVEALSQPWFSDASINIEDKDAVIKMKGVWVLELGELSSMTKAEVEHFKEFVSRRVDRIRLPYGRLAEDFPRQCILVGSTNKSEYLKDLTGNRRFWPVKVATCDVEALARDRDQLLAEARIVWMNGETLYLNDDECAGAITEQEKRLVLDTWSERLLNFIDAEKQKPKLEQFNFEKFSMSQLFQTFGPFAAWKEDMTELRRAGDTLRKCGFEKLTGGNGRHYWRQVATTQQPVQPV